MTNLIFFIAGFISFKLVRHISIALPLYLAKRQLRSKWVTANFKESSLICSRRLIK